MTWTDRPFHGLAYLAALLLAGVFAVAAVAKWRDLPGTARAMAAFGLARPWLLARTVPGVEAAIAVGLVLTPTGSAVLALALLAAFTALVASRLHRGLTGTPCRCFGTWGASTLSWVDVARNGCLMVVAVIAISGDVPRRPGIGALALTAVAGAATAAALRQIRRRERPASRRAPAAPGENTPDQA
ncbi:MAG: MauE/DoxX family redox-associated membrane protein [Acidimicrobiales bacterium]